MKSIFVSSMLLASIALLHAAPVQLVNEPSVLPPLENAFVASPSERPEDMVDVSPAAASDRRADVKFGHPLPASHLPPVVHHASHLPDSQRGQLVPAEFPRAAEQKPIVLKHHPMTVASAALPKDQQILVSSAVPFIPVDEAAFESDGRRIIPAADDAHVALPPHRRLAHRLKHQRPQHHLPKHQPHKHLPRVPKRRYDTAVGLDELDHHRSRRPLAPKRTRKTERKHRIIYYDENQI